MKNTPNQILHLPVLMLRNGAITLLILMAVNSNGQKMDFRLRAEHNEYLIGEHAALWLEVSADRLISINWPPFSDTLANGLRILKTEDRDSIMGSDGVVHFSQKIIVSAYESGAFTIDSIPISFRNPGQSWQITRYTDPITITFVLAPTANDLNIRDIQKPLRMPVTLKEILLGVFWFILSVVLIMGVYRYLRKRRNSKRVASTATTSSEKTPSPWEIALQQLKELQKSDLLWVHGVKNHYSELSHILRVYIRDAHQINAPELTTKQVLMALRHQVSISEAQHIRLKTILQCADLVKFAKHSPGNEENKTMMDEAICFVTETAPVHLHQEVNRKEEIS
jgi:hypothetical protein